MCRRIATQQNQKNNNELAHEHVVLFAAFAHDKAAIEIIYKVRRAPIELRAYGGHECREKCRDHQTAQSRRQEVPQHHHVAFFRLSGKLCARMQSSKGRVHCNGDETRNNPRPGPHRVMRDIEPQRGTQ